MNQLQYQTIQFQLENEKNELLQEISMLLQKKKQIEQKLQHEIHVFCSRGKVIKENSRTLAGMLIGDTFSSERINQLKREIKKSNDFIYKNELKLEKLNEKMSTVDSLYQHIERDKQKMQDKKMENQLLDMKMILNV